MLPLILSMAVGISPAAMPCCCAAVGTNESTATCCNDGEANRLPSCCRANLAERQQAGERPGGGERDCPPLGCCCAPAKPVATVTDMSIEPVVIWVELPSTLLTSHLRIEGLVNFDPPLIAIGGNHRRALLCVWRN